MALLGKHHWVPVCLFACSLPVQAIVIASGNTATTGVITYGETADGLNLSGVVEITSSIGGCSGTLLTGGFSILTAGHCVTSAYGQPIATGITVYFQGPGGTMIPETVANVQVNPGYTGDSTLGSDLAVLTLTSSAASFATGYSLYTNTAIPSSPEVLAGYGYGGTGLTGGDNSFGTLRAGENEYADNGALLQYSSTLLLGQFYDSAISSTNALGLAHPYSSSDEVDIAHGDSGGPSFYNGQIIGVHDLIICYGSDSCSDPPAVNTANNSYFGELYADTSVADNLAFIQGAETPEPGAIALLSGAFLTQFCLLRFRQRKNNRRAQHEER